MITVAHRVLARAVALIVYAAAGTREASALDMPRVTH